jgi:hypothetical protein
MPNKPVPNPMKQIHEAMREMKQLLERTHKLLEGYGGSDGPIQVTLAE